MNFGCRCSFMLKSAAVVLMLALFAVSADAAGGRFAVVDMDKVFKSYFKSKIAEEAIKAQADVFRQHLMKLGEEGRALESEYKVALDASQNIALSENERRTAAQKAEALSRQVKIKLAEAERYAYEKNEQMKQLELSKRSEIMEDIRREVARYAVSEGYDMVLDSTGKSLGDISVVVYSSAGNDLTERVITSLNRTGAQTRRSTEDAAKETK